MGGRVDRPETNPAHSHPIAEREEIMRHPMLISWLPEILEVAEQAIELGPQDRAQVGFAVRRLAHARGLEDTRKELFLLAATALASGARLPRPSATGARLAA